MTEHKTKNPRTKLSQKLDAVPKGKYPDVVARLEEMGIHPKNLRRFARLGNRNKGETLLKFSTVLNCEVREIMDDIHLDKRPKATKP